jgi:predicted RNase H-like HicB family nuclease
MMFQYSISLVWSDEDGGYIATVPELPNLSAFGKTPAEAVDEAQTAAGLMLEIIEEDGELPPSPRKHVEFSGQTRLRLPKTLHRDLVREAEAEGVSLNTLIVTQMAEYLGKKRRVPMSTNLEICPTVTPSYRFVGSLSLIQSEVQVPPFWTNIWPLAVKPVESNTSSYSCEAGKDDRQDCH